MLIKHPDLKEGTVYSVEKWNGPCVKDGELEVPDEHLEAFSVQFPQLRALPEQKAEPKKLAEQGGGE